jgi:hypothetical protein
MTLAQGCRCFPSDQPHRELPRPLVDRHEHQIRRPPVNVTSQFLSVEPLRGSHSSWASTLNHLSLTFVEKAKGLGTSRLQPCLNILDIRLMWK